MKNRSLRDDLKSKASSKLGRLLALTGARQTGKTTLLRKIFPDYEYISFDDPVTRSQYLSFSAAQWYANYPKAILDEAQKAPQIIETIKAVHDQHSDSRYILSGSSQILLMDKVRESLAGRVAIFELYPLTLPEQMTDSWDSDVHKSKFITWLESYPKQDDFLTGLPLADNNYCTRLPVFERYLQYGAMPILSDPELSDKDADDWLNDYISTYLQRDIRDLGNIKELEPFVLAQKAAANLTGQTINYNEIAKLAAISPKTAQRFISYLNISYQVILLQPWFRNINKRLSKSPKLHFIDPGIQRRLLSRRGELTGHEFESAVVAEIIKQLKTCRIDVGCYHLRTLDGKEVDLLLEFDEGFVPIEIKASAHVSEKDARHLKTLESILDKPIIHSFVLSQDHEIKRWNEKLSALPVVWFLG